MAKPAKPIAEQATPPPPLPTYPPRNEDDVHYIAEWFNTHVLICEVPNNWTKPLPQWPPRRADDNLRMEEWLTHKLNDQNFNRLLARFDRYNWRPELALQQSKQEGNADGLRAIIVDALTARHGKAYAERVANEMVISPKGRHKDKHIKSVVEEGAILKRQIEQLLRRRFKAHKKNTAVEWSATDFALRYLRNVRRRAFDEKMLRHKIEVRCRKRVDAESHRV
ncbi:hypothetical protein ACVIGA_000785 [Bradyrhizobium sp. USDA 3240]